jgi:hypothetical protein
VIHVKKMLPYVLFWVVWYVLAYLAMRWLCGWVNGTVLWPDTNSGWAVLVAIVGCMGFAMPWYGVICGANALDMWQGYSYRDIYAPRRYCPYAYFGQPEFSEEAIARWKALNPHKPLSTRGGAGGAKLGCKPIDR